MRIAEYLMIICALIFSGCSPRSTNDDQTTGDEIADTVIAIVSDGLEGLRIGDPGRLTGTCAEEVTYYSVELDSLLIGRQNLEEMYGPPTDQIYYDHFDLIRPTVQVFDDTVVLAFDFASYTTSDDSQLRTRWRSTQVLYLIESEWQIVHIHWTLIENNLSQ